MCQFDKYVNWEAFIKFIGTINSNNVQKKLAAFLRIFNVEEKRGELSF
jgi:hypothetical protein